MENKITDAPELADRLFMAVADQIREFKTPAMSDFLVGAMANAVINQIGRAGFLIMEKDGFERVKGGPK